MRAGARWPLQAAAGAGLLAGSWLALSRADVQRADVRVGDALRRAGTPQTDLLVGATTDLGSVYAVCGMAAALAVTGRRRAAGDVLTLGLAAWVVAQGSKTRVRRQRPYEADNVRRLVRPPTGSSFPSGHAAVGVAVAALLAERATGGRGRRALWALAAYVPASRVYVGVHYPTDVVGGAGLGLLLASLWRGPVAAGARIGLATAVRVALGRPLRTRPSPVATPVTAPTPVAVPVREPGTARVPAGPPAGPTARRAG